MGSVRPWVEGETRILEAHAKTPATLEGGRVLSEALKAAGFRRQAEACRQALWKAAQARKKLKDDQAAIGYPAGYFSAVAKRWPGLCDYVPQMAPDRRHQDSLLLAEMARKNREAGVGFGARGGTISLPNTPHNQRMPEWQQRT